MIFNGTEHRNMKTTSTEKIEFLLKMRALNILPRSCYGFLGLDGSNRFDHFTDINLNQIASYDVRCSYSFATSPIKFCGCRKRIDMSQVGNWDG